MLLSLSCKLERRANKSLLGTTEPLDWKDWCCLNSSSLNSILIISPHYKKARTVTQKQYLPEAKSVGDGSFHSIIASSMRFLVKETLRRQVYRYTFKLVLKLRLSKQIDSTAEEHENGGHEGTRSSRQRTRRSWNRQEMRCILFLHGRRLLES